MLYSDDEVVHYRQCYLNMILNTTLPNTICNCSNTKRVQTTH